jgi:hypothetical protein
VNFFRKIIAGDPYRKTRFHDEQGNLVSISEIGILPQRALEWFYAKQGRFPAEPWWPAASAERIAEICTKTSNIVEFGSGMSTVWLAKRACSVVSIESNWEWYLKVSKLLSDSELLNVELVFRTKEKFLDVPDRNIATIDLVIVDSLRRAECIDWAVGRLKQGAYIYLDNSDAKKDGIGDETGMNVVSARRRMQELCDRGQLTFECFRGFPPAQLAATEGTLARVERVC